MAHHTVMSRVRWISIAILVPLGFAAGGRAQELAGRTPQPAAATPEQPKDPLGRETPRGTVLGFLGAGQRGEDQLAREYLDTRLSGESAETLARQLFVVLNTRLPARLAQLSDIPEGSGANPLRPDQEVVGTVSSTTQGNIEIVLARVKRGQAPPVWLFSSATLDSIPAVYDEINERRDQSLLGRFLPAHRGPLRILEWASVLLGFVGAYFLTVLLNRILTPLLASLRRRVVKAEAPERDVLPTPARLLILALVGRWVLSNLTVSLFLRQLWSSAVSAVTIAAVVWLLVLLNGGVEAYVRRRLPRANAAASAALLRLVRRAVDVLIIFGGLLAVLRMLAIDATPALAGLGVGGIAVALAAQKTLENVIAGASLIFDQAVRVGDTLKMGDVTGTVDHIGLRSTRIRTLDRTVVSIPNSQIANASLETLSTRDKFWFHPVVGLRYETTAEQLHAVVDGLRRLLEEQPSIDRQSVRVRFIRLGAFSLDVEVFAYLFASDWDHFLQLQEQLLFGIQEIIDRAGTRIAFPTQTMYVTGPETPLAAVRPITSRP